MELDGMYRSGNLALRFGGGKIMWNLVESSYKGGGPFEAIGPPQS
jgi:hypothetical protein